MALSQRYFNVISCSKIQSSIKKGAPRKEQKVYLQEDIYRKIGHPIIIHISFHNMEDRLSFIQKSGKRGNSWSSNIGHMLDSS